jgi:glycolate oxidase iron-sulfur subunit
MHTGAADQARGLARHNLQTFDLSSVDAVITNAAGCGSGMHEYPLLFAGQPEEESARRFAEKVQDISVFLADLGILPPSTAPKALTVAYHDACHLAHAQGVTAAPRQLLAAIPGLKIVPIPEGEICCGSAGTYNIEQPDIADKLGQRKADAILRTGAEMVVTGNIGCMTQIGAHLDRKGKTLPLKHTVEVLDWAYGG